jgi:hypothetical protein
VVKSAAHLAFAVSVPGFYFENIPVTPTCFPIMGSLHNFRMLFIQDIKELRWVSNINLDFLIEKVCFLFAVLVGL